MTDVTSATAAQTTSPGLTGQAASLADNFEMFLTLLTEQMKNQDPLDPLDSTQFVNQLVDFSSVEQQIQQNQNLETLLLLQSASAQTSAVGYIGRIASAETPDAPLTNGSANWDYILPEDASTTALVVRDEDGREIYRANGETSTGTHSFNWDGKDSAGSQMPDGVYTLEIQSVNADGNTISPAIRASAPVTGVDLSGSEVVVEMGDIRVPLSSVLLLRDETLT